MTALEERLRAELHGYSALAVREIDETVFGPQLPDWAMCRAVPLPVYGRVICRCGAGWDGRAGSRCWACGGRGELG